MLDDACGEICCTVSEAGCFGQLHMTGLDPELLETGGSRGPTNIGHAILHLGIGNFVGGNGQLHLTPEPYVALKPDESIEPLISDRPVSTGEAFAILPRIIASNKKMKIFIFLNVFFSVLIASKFEIKLIARLSTAFFYTICFLFSSTIYPLTLKS